MGKTFVRWNQPSTQATGDKTKWGESLQFNDGAYISKSREILENI
jgi:hypothetical protein